MILSAVIALHRRLLPVKISLHLQAMHRARFQGVAPRIRWMQRAYGNGAQLSANLHNVLFSDGDKDPWRVGGVPANASAYSRDGSVQHLLIAGAAHHQDLRFSSAEDSPELTAARAAELRAVRKWLGMQ